MPTVLHSTPAMGPSYGGPFQSVRRLAQAQMAAGWEVRVRMPWSAEAWQHRDDWLPVDCEVRGRQLPGGLDWSPALARDIPHFEGDLLHTHGLWTHASWVARAWKRGHPGRLHVASPRGMLEPWALEHHGWKKRPVWWLVERFNLQSAALLHATSTTEADNLRRLGLAPPIAVVPNGVDVPELSPLDTTTLQPPRERTALFLSRLHPKKGLPLLIEAWHKARPTGWRLVIAGPDEGGHRREIEEQIHQCGLTPVIQCVGPLNQEERSRAFAESELLVLPTHSENFGMAVAEALAHGVPVITTHGAPWELLQTGRCGWWVPVSIPALAQALAAATALPSEELRTMGARGRHLMREHFSWSAVANQLLECYQWLLSGGPPPAWVRL